MPTIYIDADACPVKEEVYRVARRVGFDVAVVANSFIRTPMVFRTSPIALTSARISASKRRPMFPIRK